MKYKKDVIYYSKEYDKFRFREGNRQINQKHVDRLAESMMKIGYKGSPIEVYEKDGYFYINDGQHRTKACEIANVPIRFEVVDEIRPIREIAQENRNTDIWKRMSFINAYQTNEDGTLNINYTRLKNLIEKYSNEIGIENVLMFAGCQESGKIKNSRAVNDGYYRISEEEYNKCIEYIEKVKPAIKKLKSINAYSRSYATTIARLIKGNLVDVSRLVNKIDKYGVMFLTKVANKKQALEKLEIIYNYHEKKDNVVYLRTLLRV